MLRDNLVELIEPMPNGAGADPLAPGIHRQRQASDDRLSCLENPRPAGAESSLTENVTSPFPAEPAHLRCPTRGDGTEPARSSPLVEWSMRDKVLFIAGKTVQHRAVGWPNTTSCRIMGNEE